ncbi:MULTISPECIES: PIG-L deacetylase family protein [Thermoactinomyces]|jgi:LmbE family N-acetylglucosaminyl deacetylase|uniref:PIG-L family deacetylase n=1 Tax=Thermoactinomyces daqus TaxID=1329516 RepID=A0A7W2AIV8_9BACL|nr:MULTISPECIES: PIG-L family deacetylase [Thermoactinomyces]MBA4543298.1 PIG-L family deacetylase [Thermoactinomyces daqus]MBH8598439.1 PIG-L family deacetylase [Thermoactinomyces sp. CICC 10523]MBH8604716.1 PIG-L family deacetylase [Thermoactinomyces sp. CICC 10522]MBH8606823.1 PIG-L family deacetylase [Thermoactinomyces sp. CICC 10521]
MKKWLFILSIPLVAAGLVVAVMSMHKYKTYGEQAAATRAMEAVKPAAPKPVPSKNVVIYFSPHADDEVLTMGVPLINDIRAGKEVYLVLMSPGSHSFARERINGAYDIESNRAELAGKKLKDNLYKSYHDPYKEHYKDGWLTRKEFGDARLREFYLAAAAFGIPKDRIRVYNVVNDNFLYSQVRAIMASYAKKFPDATFKTMSRYDVHPDHAMCGRVMDDLFREHIVKHWVAYLSITTDRIMKVKVPGSQMVVLRNPADKAILLRACKAYNIWKPTEGLYAIGYHSVPIEFDMLMKKPYTKKVPL